MKTIPQDILTATATAREYLLGIEILVQKARKQRRNPADVEARLDCPMRIEPYTLAELVAAAKKTLDAICQIQRLRPILDSHPMFARV